MKEAIAQLQVANTTDQLAALAWLKDLVRPIDNANGAPSSLFRSVQPTVIQESDRRHRGPPLFIPHMHEGHTQGHVDHSFRTSADLKPLGGIEPLVAALESSDEKVRAAAAGVLATAASNNVKAQQDVADACPDIIEKLLQAGSCRQ